MLAVSLVLMLAMGALTLSRSPLRVVGVSAIGEKEVATTASHLAVCQANEVLPRGASAVRLGVGAGVGPALWVRVYSGSRILTEGRRSADWTTSSVTVPVKPVSRSVSNVKLCLGIPRNSERVWFYGVNTLTRQASLTTEGQRFSGRVSVEYLASGSGTWWSRALSVARHMGIGHAISGSWVALLVGALVAAMAVLVIQLAWRELP